MSNKFLVDYFVPENYKLFLDVSRQDKSFNGTVEITGEAKAETIFFHEKDLNVSSVTVDGQAVDFTVDNANEEITVHAGKTGHMVVAFAWTATLTDNMTGIYPSYYELNGEKKQLVGTQFETHFARQAFPSIDEPGAKATFDLALKFDEEEGDLALSNMPEISNVDGVHTFDTTVKMSSYLLAFVFGNMQAAYGETKNGTKVGVFSTRAHKPEALDFPLDIAIRVIDFYEDYFQVPYPLPHSWQIGLPDFSAGAMENWGAITYREVALLPDPDNSTQAAKQYAALVIAHELGHQWFGDLVTMQWWDDLWLNESFANMIEYVAIDAIEPSWNVMNEFAIQEPMLALNRDATDGVQSVHIEVNSAEEANTIFDGAIVYAKGSRLMTMLRKWLGDDNFRKGLKLYFERHQYGNTIGQNLWDALGEVSGRDVAGFMNSWLEQPGYPVLNVKVENDTLILDQKQFFVGQGEDKGRLYQIPLNSSWTTGLPEIFSEAHLEIPGYAALKEANGGKALLFNDENAAHYIIHYAEDLYEDILDELDSLSEITKLQLLQDKRMLATGGVIDFADVVKDIPAFAGDDSYIVNNGLSLIFNKIEGFFDEGSEAESALHDLERRTFQEQYDKLGWTKVDGEPFEAERARALVIASEIAAENTDATDKASELFAANAANPHGISAALRPSILKNQIKTAETPELVDQLFAEYVKSTDANYKREIGVALSASNNDATIDRVMDAYKNAEIIKPQDLRFWWFSLVRRDATQEKAWNWLVDNWTWLEEKLGGDMSFFQFIVTLGQTLKTPEMKAKFDAFFGPKLSDVALKRNIIMAQNGIDANIALVDSQKDKTVSAVVDMVK